MNPDECVAKAYLTKHHANVVFEPDGNIPPDFSVNQCVGVEVRRLNQQYRNGGQSRGLEEGRIPLIKAVCEELGEHPADPNGHNFWVFLRFERDIGKTKSIRKNTKSAIEAFEAQGCEYPFSFDIEENVTLKFYAEAKTLNQKYKIGIESDVDSGGFIAAIYIDAITHCISEKKQKIAPYQSRYKEWWLLLIDHIMYMNDEDKKEIISNLQKPSQFSKVIVIDQNDSSQFEI